jgi:hypothetical protein
MSLSSLIVQREVATIREVEEALARQVLYGGDLVTNLLEVSGVEESALVPLVAEQLGLPPAPLGELPSPAHEAKRLVAAEVAHERGLAPISFDDDALVVAVAEPLPREAEQELTFALAVPIRQQIAPLVRIRQALARDYGLPLDRRLHRLLARLVSGDRRGPSSVPSPGGPTVLAPPRPPSLAPPPPTRRVEDPARAGAPSTLLRDRAAPPARPGKRRRGPLTIAVARAELEDAAQRDTIFDLAFEFARQYFDYTALFVVHGDVAEGRDAFGDGASRDKVARIGVPLDLPNLLASARDAKRPVRAVPAPDGLDPVLTADLGRSGTTECVVVPIVVRTRVVALLFGDGGTSGIDGPGLMDVERVALQASAAFERLIVRRKLQGNVTASASARAAGEGEAAEESAAHEAREARDAKEAEAAGRRPSVEELAAPVRELMAEPASADARGSRAPAAHAVFTLPPLSVGPSSPRVPVETSPPPTALLAVRRPAGPPIPREEPSAGGSSPRRRSSTSMRRAEAPPLDFGARPPSLITGDAFAENDVERRLLAEIHGGRTEPAPAATDEAAPVGGRAARDDDPDATPLAPQVIDMDATPLAPPAATGPEPARPPPVQVTARRASPVMPASEQQISVPAHRPPLKHDDRSRVLPSVIVDVSSEYDALVERVVSGEEEGEDDAEAELVHAGAPAMPALMARFPGPVALDEEDLSAGPLPRASDCGPVLRVVASQRRTALPFVLEQVQAPEIKKRFWATYLLSELVYPEAIEPAVRRVFDDEAPVRRAACAATRALAEVHPKAVVGALSAVSGNAKEPRTRRLFALDGLGETREPLAVPPLVARIGDGDGEIAERARGALMTVTRQDFGAERKKWERWWSENEGRHRLEWLIDALMHEQLPLRAAASEELVAITRESFGYGDDLSKRERERSQARFWEWWEKVGRVRFSRGARSS